MQVIKLFPIHVKIKRAMIRKYDIVSALRYEVSICVSLSCWRMIFCLANIWEMIPYHFLMPPASPLHFTF